MSEKYLPLPEFMVKIRTRVLNQTILFLIKAYLAPGLVLLIFLYISIAALEFSMIYALF
jgi:hypothetical protein